MNLESVLTSPADSNTDGLLNLQKMKLINWISTWNTSLKVSVTDPSVILGPKQVKIRLHAHSNPNFNVGLEVSNLTVVSHGGRTEPKIQTRTGPTYDPGPDRAKLIPGQVNSGPRTGL